jgi:CheY-like chemotaxis protein
MDDEEVVINVCRNMLLSLKYEVDVARNGEEALEKYRRALDSGRPYRYVILDLTIPGGMGGEEAIKRMLEIDPEVKAIVSSGYASDMALDDFRKYGFAASISKPYSVEELSRTINGITSS